MKSEMTDEGAKNGWVLYDGDCQICTALVRRWGSALHRRGFRSVPLQTSWVRERLGMSESELMLEMRVLSPTGKVIGGADALLLLARSFWWAAPLVWLSHLPGMRKLLDALYRWGAARRYCVNGACTVGGGRARYASAFVLPFAVLFLLRDAAPWILMWATAGGLWCALKIFTLADIPERTLRRTIAYFLWPGMDAADFFRTDPTLPSPSAGEWLFSLLNISLGLTLVYLVARVAGSTLLAGWIGMVGMILVLHFGTFKCLALLWRTLRIPVTPIMVAPLRSRTLSEFWGRRWNTGFSIPARRYLMEPIARKFGRSAGLFTVFLVSGLAHELVISVPAGAGYGLPTLYFLIQAAIIGARTAHPRNRFFTLLCAAAPAFILFHPPFIRTVILPFFNVIGAL